MAGAQIRIETRGMERIQKMLDSLGKIEQQDLFEIIGTTVESQVRGRITEEGPAPDGQPWPPWSPRYKKTRHSNHRMLLGDGDLIDSLHHIIGAGEVEIGSNLIYFATHQFGDDDRNIPARPSLGLSIDDETDLQDAIDNYLDEILG